MPRIEETDDTFDSDTAIPSGTFVWIEETPFLIYGLAGKDGEGYYRMPPEIASRVSDGAAMLNRHTAGALVRFSTNAKTLSVRAEHPISPSVMVHMPVCEPDRAFRLPTKQHETDQCSVLHSDNTPIRSQQSIEHRPR